MAQDQIIQMDFGGIPIQLPNRAQDDWLDLYHPLERQRLVTHPLSPVGQRHDNRYGPLGFVSNEYKPPENIELNVLYWPTGASRWSEFWCYFAADDFFSALSKIDNGSTSTNTGALTFTVRDAGISGTGSVLIEKEMYLLPHRFIHGVSGDLAENLILACLVDSRYFWQDRYVTLSSPVVSGTTWQNILDDINISTKAINASDTVSFDEAPTAEYLSPDPEWFNTLECIPVAKYLDAVAYATDTRLVVDKNPGINSVGFSLQNISVAATRLFDSSIGEATAGDFNFGQFRAFPTTPPYVPEFVGVSFPQAFHHGAVCAKPYTLDFGPVVEGVRVLKGWVHTINTTCWADVTTNGVGGDPDNNAELQALASAYALNWYNAFVFGQFDFTTPGINDFSVPTALNDMIHFNICRLRDDSEGGGYEISTRFIGAPVNQRETIRPNQQTNFNVYRDSIRLQLTEDVGATTPNQVAANIIDGNASGTGEDLIAHDPLGIFVNAVAATKGYADWACDENRWELKQGQCPEDVVS